MSHKNEKPRRPGHEWMLSEPLYDIPPQSVDREKGVLRGVAICTEGMARGHGYSLDADFIKDVVAHGNAKNNGVKVRFGHPNMSSTALGTFLGRGKHYRAEELGGKAVARADIFLSNEAKETPQGNLHDYVMGMAENEPDMCGFSIVFERGDFYRRTVEGKKVKRGDEDHDVAPSRQYVELKKLHSNDMVDSPAANPDGAFSAWSRETFAGQVTEFIDTHPEILDVVEAHPEVVDEFLSRYREHLKRKGKTMSDPQHSEGIEAEDQTVEPEAEESTAEIVEADTAAATDGASEEALEVEIAGSGEGTDAPAAPPEEPLAEPELSEDRREARRFVDAFGEKGGVWFAEGKTFDQAQDLNTASLHDRITELGLDLTAAKAQIADLAGKLELARKQMGAEPVAADPDEPDPEKDEFEKLVEFHMTKLECDREEAERKAKVVIGLRRKREKRS